MKYFKNTELAKIYKVSEKSVRNWIDATKDGKLSLTLYESNGKSYIANVASNMTILEQLVEKGRKYQNGKSYKVVQPTPYFYKLFNPKDILNIISSLDIHHELPLQYSYFDGGAKIWDAYIKRLSEDISPNILANTVELIRLDLQYIDNLLGDCKRVNIIDIGPGNGYPIRDLLDHLVSTERLDRYIPIDISPDMLRMVKKNVHSWFGDKVHIEAHIRDIAYERFTDVLVGDSFAEDNDVRNIVVFFGSTLSNFRDPNHILTTIHESMGKNDMLFFTKQLDTMVARRHFDFDVSPNAQIKLSPMGKFMFELLGVDEELYDAEQYFDDRHMARHVQIKLNVALQIKFELDNKSRSISFNKDDVILFWRHRHQNVIQTLELFDRNGFDLQQALTSRDAECLLTISKVKAS